MPSWIGWLRSTIRRVVAAWGVGWSMTDIVVAAARPHRADLGPPAGAVLRVLAAGAARWGREDARRLLSRVVRSADHRPPGGGRGGAPPGAARPGRAGAGPPHPRQGPPRRRLGRAAPPGARRAGGRPPLAGRGGHRCPPDRRPGRRLRRRRHGRRQVGAGGRPRLVRRRSRPATRRWPACPGCWWRPTRGDRPAGVELLDLPAARRPRRRHRRARRRPARRRLGAAPPSGPTPAR